MSERDRAMPVRNPAGGESSSPTISVVTPSLNQAGFIEGNIRSVLAQDYPNFEHIVVDGASTDGTLEILGRYPHLRWVSERDRSMTEALNKGFRMATGEIVAWLNTDDRHTDGALSRVADLFERHPDRVIVFGDALLEDRVRGREVRLCGRPFKPDEVVRFWDSEYFLHQPAIFLRREALERVGYLDESLRLAADYDLWVRLSQRYEFHYVPHAFAQIIRHDAAITASFDRWREEVLVASKRRWGPPGSPRWLRYWSSWKGRMYLDRGHRALSGGRRVHGLGPLLLAVLVRPRYLAWITWWSLLARTLMGSGWVDRIKRRIRGST